MNIINGRLLSLNQRNVDGDVMIEIIDVGDIVVVQIVGVDAVTIEDVGGVCVGDVGIYAGAV